MFREKIESSHNYCVFSQIIQSPFLFFLVYHEYGMKLTVSNSIDELFMCGLKGYIGVLNLSILCDTNHADWRICID